MYVMESRDQKGQSVQPVPKGRRVPQDHKVSRACRDQSDQKARLELPDPKALRESKGRKGHRDQPVRTEQTG